MTSLESLVGEAADRLPGLPIYSDDENRCFHPVAFAAARLAFKHFEERSSVRFFPQDQYRTPAGPADMVVVEDSSGAPWIPIEIKKYRSDVRSKGRRQANDYRDNIGGIRTPLYVSTNLEIFEVFKFEPGRPAVVAQRLKTQYSDVGLLAQARSGEESSKLDFYVALSHAFLELIEIAYGLRPAVYEDGFFALSKALETSYETLDDWHRSLAPISFDIIRLSGLIEMTKSWRPATYYRRNPRQLAELAKAVDFSAIFDDPIPTSLDNHLFDVTTHREIQLRAGDSTLPLELSTLVNEETFRRLRNGGVVSTDPDLAHLLAVVGTKHLAEPFAAYDRVLDPCAGSGNLLTALSKIEMPGVRLKPSQIMAVEINPHFTEALSLSLGLSYSLGLSPENHPEALIQDFLSVTADQLADVRLALVNPPFQSRSRSLSSGGDVFGLFTQRIQAESNNSGQLIGGQSGLEKLFLELLCLRVRPGTTVAAIIPKKLITAPGPTGDAFRRYLLGSFGLREIVTYPSDDLFSEVVVETAIIVGRKPEMQEVDWPIHITSVFGTVPQLKDEGLVVGLNCEEVISKASELGDGISEWRGQMLPVVSHVIAKVKERIGGPLATYRGRYGNKGLSQELAFNDQYNNAMPGVAMAILLVRGMPPRILNAATTTKWTVPAHIAASFKDSDILRLWKGIRREPAAGGQQKKHPKTSADLPKVLTHNTTTKHPAVIIPRDQRRYGQISVLDTDLGGSQSAVFSTNYFISEQRTLAEAKLVGPWLLSIFGQLLLELYSKPERGPRKLEQSGISLVGIPSLSTLSDSTRAALISAFASDPPLDFSPDSKRQPRQLDHLWSTAIFGDAADAALRETFEAFEDLLRDRLQGA